MADPGGRTRLTGPDTVASPAGPVDLLVNNAGFGVDGPIEEVPLDDVRRAMETSFFGPARMVQAFVPAMREQSSGTVVNVTSVAGVVAGPLAGHHAADPGRP